MVLSLKRWKSRSSPGIAAGGYEGKRSKNPSTCLTAHPAHTRGPTCNRPHNTRTTAGWSSPVARQAHNLKVTGSKPVPATNSETKNAKWKVPEVRQHVIASAGRADPNRSSRRRTAGFCQYFVSMPIVRHDSWRFASPAHSRQPAWQASKVTGTTITD